MQTDGVTELPSGGFAAVLARAGTGDQEALRSLFRAYQPRLLRFLRGLEPAAADDLAGEVWLGVARRPAWRGASHGGFDRRLVGGDRPAPSEATHLGHE